MYGNVLLRMRSRVGLSHEPARETGSIMSYDSYHSSVNYARPEIELILSISGNCYMHS